MKRINQVSNGVNSAEFPTTVIDKMKMLGLIQARGSAVITREGEAVRVYRYTAAFDNRQPRGKW